MTQAQTSIWEHVKELLHQHDCVIVPGFGGFVCNREVSRIDQISHVITPPSRKVVFNQNLKSNDGLLAGHLAHKKQIPYTQAIQLIDEAVEHTLLVLQDKKQFAIDLFGNFRLNADANYVFLPDKRNNYLTSSFGLSIIQATPVATRNIKVNKPLVFRDRKVPKTFKSKRNIWPTTLVAVLVVVLSVNGYIFFNDHSLNDLRIGSNNTMSITSWFDSLINSKSAPETTVAKPLEVPVVVDSSVPPPPVAVEDITPPVTTDTIPTEVVPAPTTELDAYAPLYAFASHYESARSAIYFPQQIESIDSTIEVVEPVNVPVVAKPVVSTVAPHLSTVGIAKGYYVIGGVFCKERNAKRFIKQLNESGYTQAELLLNSDINCKRVSYQKFSSRKEAEQFCGKIQSSENPAAWVLASE